MVKKLQSEPALGGAILSILGAILGIFIHNPDLVAGLLGVAAVFLGVRQVVTPVTTAVTQTVNTAGQTATQVVAQLDHTTVGTVGEVTDAAKSIINNVVGGITSTLKGA